MASSQIWDTEKLNELLLATINSCHRKTRKGEKEDVHNKVRVDLISELFGLCYEMQGRIK